MAKALFLGIGINAYPGCPLKGCLNDIKETLKNLSEKFGFARSVILNDNTERKPTYDNIIAALYEVAIASWRDSLDVVWIHYSGHGSRVVDKSGDETSGMDSGWCPIDYDRAGVIIDDLLSRILKTFNPRTKVVVFSDSCHSATIADLDFCYDVKKSIATGEGSGQKRMGATAWDQNIIVISGCLDTGTSADAYFAATGSFGGALTAYFWKIVASLGPIITIKAVIDELHARLTKDGYEQYPVITSTRPLKGDAPFIVKKGALWSLA